MNFLRILIFLLVIYSSSLSASVIYVDSTQTTQTPDGSTWATAFFDLQDALSAAQFGDEIWTAAGTYYPTQDATDRTASFVLPSGVRMLGGFIGTETLAEQRNWENNLTSLSGDIDEDPTLQNSYHILELTDTDSTTLIDGFIIEKGEATVAFPGEQANRHGAAIYHLQTLPQTTSGFTLRNCILRRHRSFSETFPQTAAGGSIYNKTNSGNISIEVDNCTFVDIDGEWKVMYNENEEAGDSLLFTFKKLIMQGNQDEYGIIMMSHHQAYLSFKLFESSIFNYKPLKNLIQLAGDNNAYNLDFYDSTVKDNLAVFDIGGNSILLKNEGSNNNFDINCKSLNYLDNEIGGFFLGGNHANANFKTDSILISNGKKLFFSMGLGDTLDLNVKNTILSGNIGFKFSIQNIIKKSHCAFRNLLIENAVISNKTLSVGSNSNSVESYYLLDNIDLSNNTFSGSAYGEIEFKNKSNKSIYIKNSTFSNNILNSFSTNSFLNSHIRIFPSDNSSQNNIILENCIFSEKQTASPALATAFTVAPFHNSDLLDSVHHNLTVNNCIFNSNSGARHGAVYLRNTDAVFNNCLFYDNEAASGQGSSVAVERIDAADSTAVVFNNCTFADSLGYAVFNNSSDFTFRNCLFDSDSILLTADSLAPAHSTFFNSLFRNPACPPAADSCVASVFAADPLFVAADTGNYALSACSPAYNLGNPDFIDTDPLTEDLAGNARIADGLPEAGAYEIPALSAQLIAVAPDTCNALPDGGVTLSVASFCPPLTYAWQDGESPDISAEGLAAGSYQVTVTDARMRSATVAFVIPDTLRFTTESVVKPADCALSLPGSIDLTLSGGTAPYTFAWNDGVQSEDREILGGMYTVTITDENGCLDSLSFESAPEGVLSVELVLTPIICHDDANGSLTPNISGGFDPLTYTWQDGSADSVRVGLAPGDYALTVSDDYGCTGSTAAALDNPTQIIAAVEITNAATSQSTDGSLTVTTVFGGTEPYTLLWETGETDPTIDNLPPDTYTLSVTDAAGCTEIFEYVVDFNTSVAEISDGLEIMPNPVGIAKTLYVGSDRPCRLQWRDLEGRLVGFPGAQKERHRVKVPQAAGVYLLEMHYEDGTVTTRRIVVQ